MLQLLIGRDWTENIKEILRRIGQDVRQKKGNRILIVPELISHEMERKLCEAGGDTTSRYVEVLSFTRLARRLPDSMGSAAMECLDDGGRVVAMASAARQLSSRLKAYASVETKPEFLTGLIDAIDEFKRCCITSQMLMEASQATEGSLAQKLEELSLLMETYDALCSRGRRDPRDQMTWVLEHLEDSDFAQTHCFYIDGFPDFTRQNLAVMEHFIRVSPMVTISLNCDGVDSPRMAFEKAGDTARQLLQCAHRWGIETKILEIDGRTDGLAVVRDGLFQGPVSQGAARAQLNVYRTESVYQECLAAANQVMELAAGGCRYRDITLVCSDIAVYEPVLNLIFRRFHLPLYRSGTEEILQKSVIATVLNALEAALSDFDQRNTLRYLRSALSPLEPDVCDEVENYVVVWGIRGQKWTKPWENHPDGLSGVWDDSVRQRMEALNEAREQLVLPLQQLQKGFRGASNVKDQIQALYTFLLDIQLDQRLEALEAEMDAEGDNRSAQILDQLWEILLSAMEQMYDVLGETSWDSENFSRLFRLLLSQYKVGTIPPVLDAVQMGPVSAMRCHQEKHLILLGAEEGKLPGYGGSAGVLTDQERVALREMGVPLTGGAAEGIQAEFAEIYGVFCGATESISVYCSGEQPSYIYRRLAELVGGEQHWEDTLGFAKADAFEAGAYFARWNAEEAAQQLAVAQGFDLVSGRKDFTLGRIAPENIRKLYGNTLNLSASQVDRQAECRLSYFLKYGLRAKERKEAVIDPAEFGTYVHAVLENTARCIRDMGGFRAVSLEETLEIAHRFSDEYAAEHFSQVDSERMTYLFRRNIRELDMVVRELWTEMKDSLFEAMGFEVSFGGGDGLPPIAIPNGSMHAILRGFIDRVDTWNTAGNTYYRVVDYKTGRKDFDYCDVFNGVGLQMLLYLFALRDSGSELLEGHAVPAGVQYFPARAPYLSAEGKLTEEDAEAERQSQWKRRGLLLQDEAVLQAMEPGDDPQRMCYTIKKDGTLTGDLADRDQLKLLETYIFRVLGKMVEEIASGDVQPNPYTRGSSHDACAYCPYGTICHKDHVEGRRNYQAMKAQRFWEEIRKEMDHHGR